MRALVSLAVLLLLAVSNVAVAEDLTPQKRADIKHVLRITGAVSLGKQMGGAMAAQLIQTLRHARPDIPESLLNALPEEIEKVVDAHSESMIDEILVPIYHKYFTASEVKEMIRFYSSDLGKKTIQVMPALMQESISAGQAWGESIGPEIEARIKARFKSEGISI